MRIEPSEDEGMDDFVVVEDGTHRMKVAAASELTAPDGRVSWMLRLELVEGEQAGKTATIDWLNFTEKGLHRARLVLGALGFDVSKELEVEPAELFGRQAYVRVVTQEAERRGDGRLQRRSRVTYDGWSPVESTSAPAEAAGAGSSGGSFAADEMPF